MYDEDAEMAAVTYNFILKMLFSLNLLPGAYWVIRHFSIHLPHNLPVEILF